jgi:predicted nucleic acid-binding protein
VELTHLGHPQLNRAGRLEPTEVRTLDAIHLEAAIRLRSAATVAAVLTHDKQLRRGCEHHGIPLAM